MNTDSTEFHRLMAKQIDRAGRVAVISHVNPDGDAVGSSLGLTHYLKNRGKEAFVIVPNQYPDFLKWLPGSEKVIIYKNRPEATGKIIGSADLIFMLDFNSPERAGDVESSMMKSGAFKILIDHHPGNPVFADHVISDPLSSSTAELVFRFLEMTGEKDMIDTDCATCLYAGIMSDTGSFSYNSSQPETYRVLSELLRKGIDKDNIYSKVYDNFSENRLRLLGYCLDRKMVVLPQFRTAYISLDLEEKKMYRYIRGDSEGFVNYPLSVSGVEFVAFFMENDDHVKISFRSKGDFNVNAFAEKNFGGGGHVNASGGESKLSLAETINKFVSLLPLYLP